LAGQFYGARAALLTAILALEGKGVHTQIATSLRMHVLNSMDQIQRAVTGRGELP
jgi:hypothetical protein